MELGGINVMGMTEYEKRMVELEKKKVKILTDILKELIYMNKTNPRADREYLTMAAEEVDSEISESILAEV